MLSSPRFRRSLVALALLVIAHLARPADLWAEGAGGHPPPRVALLIEKARAAKLADHKAWQRLGHYRSGWFSGPKSEVDGAKFFLSPEGKRDPEAELDATLRAFYAPIDAKTPDEHALCRFPARLMWLVGALQLDPASLPAVRCAKFGEFVQRLKPGGATLVFSSYYLNNPASAFGHTFLRIDNALLLATGSERDLLHYGVDYAATVDEPNPLLYALKGLVGAFPGHFKAMPYYYKVREYNDFESRDLWEYRLGLSPAQIVQLVAHLWELGDTHIDYWYLDENCSYHILGALEAALPDVALVADLRTPVLPAETVRVLAKQEGLVRALKYRPSPRTQLRARLRDLNAEERELVAALGSDAEVAFPATLALERRRLVLDAAADLVDARFARELLAQQPGPAMKKQRILERRAALGGTSPPVEVDSLAGAAPHTGHGAGRLSLGGGYSDQGGGFAELDFRLALHDLSDPTPGYPATAQIEFLPMRASFYPDLRKAYLEDASLVRIVSLTPLDAFEKRFSWKFRVGGTTLRDLGCDGPCLVGIAELGGGVALSFLRERLILFAMADTQVASGPGLDDAGVEGTPLRAGFGPSGGARLILGPRVTFLAQGQWLYLPFQEPTQTFRADATLRIAFSPSWALALEGRAFPEAIDARGLLAFYY